MENGDSRFEDVEIPLEASGEIGSLSELSPATGVVLEKLYPIMISLFIMRRINSTFFCRMGK